VEKLCSFVQGGKGDQGLEKVEQKKEIQFEGKDFLGGSSICSAPIRAIQGPKGVPHIWKTSKGEAYEKPKLYVGERGIFSQQ